MTRHLSEEERRQEILHAAAREVADRGVGQVTMAAIAARTSLSKGGVYRFYANKREVLLDLFRYLMMRYASVEHSEALGWGKSLTETLVYITLVRMCEEEEADGLRWGAVWVQLLPEALWDEAFAQVLHEGEGYQRQRFGALVLDLLRRDGMRLRPGADLDRMLRVGVAYGEGMLLALLLRGEPMEELVQQFGFLIDLLIRDLVETREGGTCE